MFKIFKMKIEKYSLNYEVFIVIKLFIVTLSKYSKQYWKGWPT